MRLSIGEARDEVLAAYSADVEAGDEVVVVLREGGEGKGSGLKLHQVIGMVFTLAQGKIVRVRLFREPSAALEPAGLAE